MAYKPVIAAAKATFYLFYNQIKETVVDVKAWESLSWQVIATAYRAIICIFHFIHQYFTNHHGPSFSICTAKAWPLNVLPAHHLFLQPQCLVIAVLHYIENLRWYHHDQIIFDPESTESDIRELGFWRYSCWRVCQDTGKFTLRLEFRIPEIWTKTTCKIQSSATVIFIIIASKNHNLIISSQGVSQLPSTLQLPVHRRPIYLTNLLHYW